MIVPILKKFQNQWEGLNDWFLNIDTRTIPHLQHWKDYGVNLPVRHNDGVGYQSVDYLNLRKIRRLVKIEENDTVYDLGCGKGRILCVFAQARARKCIGVEIFPELCEIARRNAERLRGRRSPIEVRCQDVSSADLSDGTVFFMFNPFGRETMQAVLDQISRSLIDKPRKVRLIYCNPRAESSIASCTWLKKIADYRTLGGMSVVMYQNVL